MKDKIFILRLSTTEVFAVYTALEEQLDYEKKTGQDKLAAVTGQVLDYLKGIEAQAWDELELYQQPEGTYDSNKEDD